MEFQTEVDFFGETRPATVIWEPFYGDVYISAVEVALLIESNWTPKGEYRRYVERLVMDVLPILSDAQAMALTKEIRAACAKARGEDYDDSKLQDWQERQYRRAA